MGRYKLVHDRDQKAYRVVERKSGRTVAKQKTKRAAMFDGVWLSEGRQEALKHVPRNKRA